MDSPGSYGRQLFNQFLWVPVFILFSYPLVYGALPHLLLRGKVSLFFLAVLAWGSLGLYIDPAFRSYIYIPIQESMGLDFILPRGPLAFCYLCMTTSAASPMILKFFKLCTIKQRDWIQGAAGKDNRRTSVAESTGAPSFFVQHIEQYLFLLDK
jgi:hypothetical protein